MSGSLALSSAEAPDLGTGDRDTNGREEFSKREAAHNAGTRAKIKSEAFAEERGPLSYTGALYT